MRAFPQLPSASPLPTAAPSAELIRRRLEVRQAGVDGGSTCGYFSGDPDNPATCDFGYTCAVNSFHSVHGCCEDLNSCNIATSCVPYTSMSACNSACQNDPFVILCSDQFAPDCFTNTFPSASLSGFGCGSGAVIVDTVLPTFSGQAQVASSIIGAAASLKSVVATETATDDSDVTAILEEIDSLTSEAAFIATASITPGAANMGTAAVTESDVVVSWSRPADPSFQSIPFFTSPSGSAPTNNNNNNNQDQSSSTSPSPGLPPGLIAAIAVPTVIGAVILAALTVLLILCIRKRNRRRRAAQNPAIGPYTSPYAPPSAGNAYPDTYGVNKEFSVHSHNVVSPNSNPSMSVISPWSGSSPYPSGTAEMDGYGPHSVYYSPGLNRENLDALSRSGSGPRRSDELARERRLSEDGNTAVPEPSVAGRTNWTADTFAVAGGRRAGY